MTQPTHDAVMEALARVIDPELHRPITDLGMVSSVDIAEDGVVSVEVLLTVAGCPLKDTITADTRREVGTVEGVTEVQVSLGVMNDEQKAELRRRLRGGAAEPVVPFTQPGNLTREIAALRLAMNDVATRDFVRSELRDMLSEILAEERLTREEIAEFQDSGDDEPDTAPEQRTAQ